MVLKKSLFYNIIESTFGYPHQLTPYDEEATLGAAVNAYSQLSGEKDNLILEKLKKR